MMRQSDLDSFHRRFRKDVRRLLRGGEQLVAVAPYREGDDVSRSVPLIVRTTSRVALYNPHESGALPFFPAVTTADETRLHARVVVQQGDHANSRWLILLLVNSEALPVGPRHEPLTVAVGDLYTSCYMEFDNALSRFLSRLGYSNEVISRLCAEARESLAALEKSGEVRLYAPRDELQASAADSSWWDTHETQPWNSTSACGPDGERRDVEAALVRLRHKWGVRSRARRLGERIDAGEYVQSICSAEYRRFNTKLGMVALTNRRVVVMRWNMFDVEDWHLGLGFISGVRTEAQGDTIALYITGGDPYFGAHREEYIGHLPADDAPAFLTALAEAVANGPYEPDEAPLASVRLAGDLNGPELSARLYPDRLELDHWEASTGRIAGATAASVVVGTLVLNGLITGGVHGPRRVQSIRLANVTAITDEPTKSGLAVTVLGDGAKATFIATPSFASALHHARAEAATQRSGAPSPERRQTERGADIAAQLERLTRLAREGHLTPEEYAAAKAKALGN